MAAAAPPLITIGLASARGGLNLLSDALVFLVLVVVVALVGGLYPALFAAVVTSLLLNFYFIPPLDTFTIAEANNVLALVVFVAVAIAVSAVVDLAARRTRQAARANAQSETLATMAGSVLRGESGVNALLEQVSESFGMTSAALLQRPAGADAGPCGPADTWAIVGSAGPAPPARPEDADVDVDVGDGFCLALRGHPLPADERRVLGLLDLSRLQAGELSLRSGPTDVADAVAHALASLGPPAAQIRVMIPTATPLADADPALLERVLVNLLSNAIRYSPAGTPPTVTASALSDRVELRIIDQGPASPRPAGTGSSPASSGRTARAPRPGTGLGLALSRGLTEAMHGTLTPEDTPGGGLTMIVSLPAAGSIPARAVPAASPPS